MVNPLVSVSSIGFPQFGAPTVRQSMYEIGDGSGDISGDLSPDVAGDVSGTISALQGVVTLNPAVK